MYTKKKYDISNSMTSMKNNKTPGNDALGKGYYETLMN